MVRYFWDRTLATVEKKITVKLATKSTKGTKGFGAKRHVS